MSNSIKLHKEFGLNATITKCFYCGADKEIALLGASCKEKAPMSAVIDKYPCAECKKVFDVDGAIIIEVRDGETGENPFRTGFIIGITKEAKEKIVLKGFCAYFTESVLKNYLGSMYDEIKGERNVN